MVEIRRLSGAETIQKIVDLANILLDCVQGGASVSFMATLSQEEAENFFRTVAAEIDSGNRILLAAFVDAQLVGTVQLLTTMPPNQPHRGELAKLLVLRSARSQGLGSRLMQHAEQFARAAGKTLLVLDTATGGEAERLYQRLGWTKAGVIPNYALWPDGAPCATTIFWKEI